MEFEALGNFVCLFVCFFNFTGVKLYPTGSASSLKFSLPLIKEISGKDVYELIEHVDYYRNFCDGASRKGANGARAKLEYIKEPLKNGTTVYIANSCYDIKDVMEGKAPSTKIFVG